MSSPQAGWGAEVRRGTEWIGQRSRALLPRSADYRSMRIAPQRDLIAGITVGVVALPSRWPSASPGLGAAAGLITAVVAGTVAAVFGEATCRCPGQRVP